MIPQFKLYNGVNIPAQGLGTFTLSGDIMTEAIRAAYLAGCSLLDTASAYGTEQYVGTSIKKLEKEGVFKRSDLFIQTKVGDKITPQGKPIGYYFYNSPSCPNHDTEKVVNQQVENSLRLLKTDYLDLVMIHWPYYDVLNEIWSALEKLYEQGVVKAIGVSNCRKRHIERVLKTAKVVPMVNQTNISPINTMVEDYQYFVDNQITIQAYSPMSTLRNSHFKVEQKKILNELPVRYGHSMSQILFRWFYQKNIITIPRSKNPFHVKGNYEIYDFELCEEDMKAFDNANFDYQHLVESLYCPGY